MSKLKILSRMSGQFFTNRTEFLKGVMRLTKELWSKQQVIKKYNLADGLPVVSLQELFPDFNETVKSYSYLDGTSKAIDIAFIKAMVKSKPNCSYIEFGSWRGESLINICDEAGSCYSITLSETEMKQFGLLDTAIAVNGFFVKNTTNIHKIEHNSQTYDYKDLVGKFDVVFVDADHEYPGVKIDTENARTLLKDDSSVIIWHDYGRSYEEINWQVLHGMLDGIPKDEHQYMYKVGNTLCGLYTKQPVKSGRPKRFYPEKTYSVSIKAEKSLHS